MWYLQTTRYFLNTWTEQAKFRRFWNLFQVRGMPFPKAYSDPVYLTFLFCDIRINCWWMAGKGSLCFPQTISQIWVWHMLLAEIDDVERIHGGYWTSDHLECETNVYGSQYAKSVFWVVARRKVRMLCGQNDRTMLYRVAFLHWWYKRCSTGAGRSLVFWCREWDSTVSIFADHQLTTLP